MKKPILIALAVIIIGIAGFLLLRGGDSGGAAVDQEDIEENPVMSAIDVLGAQLGSTLSLSGEITFIDTTRMAADGPAVINMGLADGKQVTITVVALSTEFCPGNAHVTDVTQLKKGDKIEVKGDVGEGGTIQPCESADHYLRPAKQ